MTADEARSMTRIGTWDHLLRALDARTGRWRWSLGYGAPLSGVLHAGRDGTQSMAVATADAGSLPHLPEQRCGLAATLTLSQPPTQQGHGARGQFTTADCQPVAKLYSLG